MTVLPNLEVGRNWSANRNGFNQFVQADTGVTQWGSLLDLLCVGLWHRGHQARFD